MNPLWNQSSATLRITMLSWAKRALCPANARPVTAATVGICYVPVMEDTTLANFQVEACCKNEVLLGRTLVPLLMGSL